MNFIRKLANFGADALWRILTVVAAFLLILSVAGSAVMSEWSGYINKTLGIQDTIIVETGDGEQDPTHFKSEFESYTDVMANAQAVAKQAQAEGTVLMKNDGGASDVIVEHCGDIYFMNGETEKAVEYWLKAKEIGSESKTIEQKIQQKRYIPEK